ncbi:glutamine amidotransferase [Crateriforma conspicua]|uniref:Putative glutamine amidotransferase domain-containing protein n=1 Tax=Crateriforma conspicua TaxID=2527996 RepID=A0A5C6FPC3_9PLAN|nr:glutamine amidotransferase [Crateriforma conspicua]TWU63082.1 hypothetical protein V7x_48200 [Crateriforma conspicua]
MTRWQIDPLFDSSWLALLVAVVVALVLLMITPSMSDPRRFRTLLGLRSLAAGCLLLVLLGPSWVRVDQQPSESSLVIAMDTSQSMSLSDGDAASRWDIQRSVVQSLTDQLETVSERLQIIPLTYASTAETENSDPATLIDQSSPVGRRTDLASPIRWTLQSANRQSIEGLILIGDGANTVGPETTSAGGAALSADQAASVMDSIGLPLWTIPIGPASQNDQRRDVAVSGLPESFRLFAGTQFDLRFELESRGLAGTEIPIRLRWIDSQGNETDAAVRRIVSESAISRTPVQIAVDTPAPGSYRLEVQADVMPGETVRPNNTQVAFVDVMPGGGRIYYLEGQPREEQQFLRRALRFPDLDLDYQWIPADSRSRWPVSLGDDLTADSHDVFIIGDLEASAVGDQQWQSLADAVASGSGLVMLGGMEALSAGGYQDTPLAGVLPVDLSRIGNADIPGPLTLRPSIRHPITMIDTPRQTTWAQLPPLNGASNLGAPRSAPGVQTLLESTDGNPLLVVGEYGRGRVAVLGIDETFRWHRYGFQNFHRRFWRQLVLWLLARDGDSGEEIQLNMTARRFSDDAPAGFTAIIPPPLSPRDDWTVQAVADDGSVTPLTFDSQSSQDDGRLRLEGQLPTSLAAGIYQLRVTGGSTSEPTKDTSLGFEVLQDIAELSRSSADPVLMRQLAGLTRQSGGQSFGVDQTDELVDLIRRSRQRNVATIVQKNRLGDGPISGWIMYLLFATALGSEWILRRRWGMV